MKTKLFASLIAAIMFVGITANAQQKIGYTNVDYILNNLPDAKDIETKLKTEKAQYDKLLKDKIFAGVTDDPLHQAASVRDGALSILVGIAARKSCDSGQPVKIGDLTSIKPGIKRQFVTS